MIRSVFGKERFLNEAKESDFAGKDTVIVVGVVSQKMVQKKEKEMRRRDDDGFSDKSRNYGVEAYYLVDKATADRLMSTCLFFSTVDPEQDQIMYMLKGAEPVVVHRSAGTNFGYRTSNEFDQNCANLKQVMETVFGAKDVKVFSFRAAWNSGRNRSYRSDSKLLFQEYGVWESVELPETETAVSRMEIVKQTPYQSFRQYGQKLAAMKDKFVDRYADFEVFLTMKSKPFSLSEQDASDLRSEAMMAELQEGGWKQQEFPFMKDAQAQDEKDAERETGEMLHKIGEAAAAKVGGLRYARGNVDGDGTWSDGFLDDGRYVVDHQYKMYEPSDSDFYERHSPFLEELAKALPAGWKAEYTNWEDAPDSKMIGTKYIDSKEVDRTSGPWGAEDEITYSVVEELTLTRAAVSEGEDLEGEPALPLDEGESADNDPVQQAFCAAFEAKFPDVDENDYEVLCYDEDGRTSLNLRVYDPGKAHSSAFGRRVEAMMKDFGCVEIERVDVPDEPDWATWQSFYERSAAGADAGAGDSVRVDFPAWALDYWVNAELGSVSRQERDQIEAWRGMMEVNGYDTGMVDFGEEEFFSSSPEFGLPCDCVEAVVPLKK